MNKEKLSFQTDISVDLELLEISEQVNLKDAKTIELLEKKAEEKITKQYEQLLDELKELDSDALGYGAIYRMEERDLTQREWDEKFPEIEVEFKVDANIIHHGEHF